MLRYVGLFSAETCVRLALASETCLFCSLEASLLCACVCFLDIALCLSRHVSYSPCHLAACWLLVHGISKSAFYDWRKRALAGQVLAEHGNRLQDSTASVSNELIAWLHQHVRDNGDSMPDSAAIMLPPRDRKDIFAEYCAEGQPFRSDLFDLSCCSGSPGFVVVLLQNIQAALSSSEDSATRALLEVRRLRGVNCSAARVQDSTGARCGQRGAQNPPGPGAHRAAVLSQQAP